MPNQLLLVFCTILLHTIKTTNAQDVDWSFGSMCKFWGGEGSYKPRIGGFQAMTGDLCSFKFPVATEDKEAARLYCEENVPYHINEVVSGDDTICHAEATLICASGWVQMFGRCYKMEKTLMTREEAVNNCSKQEGHNSTIAFMHREALPFRIRDYFTSVSRLWLDASEAITHDLIYNVKGGYLLLAIDGYNYNLPHLALARVKTTEKAMVLCEYTPPMNQAESNYLLRRFGEIYYPTIFAGDKAYVRSASVLQRAEQKPLHDNNYCKKVLRPFLQTDNAQSAVPTREFLEKLAEKRRAEIIRTSVYSGDAKMKSRINAECAKSNSRNYGMDFPGDNNKTFFKSLKDAPIWRSGEPNEECDGGSWSTGVVLSRSKDIGLEAMSDARYAPIYCQTNFDVMEYGGCPDGFKPFHRKELGQKYCHKFVSKLVDFDTAEQECRKIKAHVSGFTGQEELDFLDGMLDAAKANGTVFNNHNNIWIGAKRRKSCDRLGVDGKRGGFNPDETHQCSRLRVFEWVNGVAYNPPDFLTRWAHHMEPNFASDKEQCVQLLKGPQKRPAWQVLGDKKLNDVTCNLKHYFFCGKEAPIVVKKKDQTVSSD